MNPVATIWRRLQLPDPVRIRRCETMPELGPKILFFSGGSALNKISRALKNYTHNSIHLVTPFDSGGSSSHLRNAFSMPAVGDLRSRLMALADETVLGQPEIYALFDYRLAKKGRISELRQELANLAAGQHSLMAPITGPMRQLICTQLSVTQAHIDEAFDLRGASVGNLIIAGGYLNNQQQLDPIVFLFSRLVKVLGEVQTIADVALHLAAELDDGRIIIGQHRLTGKEQVAITSPIKRIFLNESLTVHRPTHCEISRDRYELIEMADLICYPPGSFYSSVLVNLLPMGVASAIQANPSPKVYLPNLGVDPEQMGLTLLGQVEQLIKSITGGPLAAQGVLDYVILDESLAWSLDEQMAIKALGVQVISASLLQGQKKHYDEEAVAQLLVSLV